jgi:hypothetical protein
MALAVMSRRGSPATASSPKLINTTTEAVPMSGSLKINSTPNRTGAAHCKMSIHDLVMRS